MRIYTLPNSHRAEENGIEGGWVVASYPLREVKGL